MRILNAFKYAILFLLFGVILLVFPIVPKMLADFVGIQVALSIIGFVLFLLIVLFFRDYKKFRSKED